MLQQRIIPLLFCCFVCSASFLRAQNANIISGASFRNFSPETYLSPSIIRIQKLDSIAAMTASARPFANLYKQTMANISLQLENFDTAARHFIEKFETHFAGYFFAAVADQDNGQLQFS